jgi:hypothetical protein
VSIVPLRSLAFTALVTLLVLWAMGCDSPEQTVDIVAEDFRFTPAEVRVAAERPIRLRIVNAGREPHEFKSVLLVHQTWRHGHVAQQFTGVAQPQGRDRRSTHSRGLSLFLRDPWACRYGRDDYCRVKRCGRRQKQAGVAASAGEKTLEVGG